LPADGHDTVVMAACPPVLAAALPGTSAARPQVPFTSSATNACRLPDPSL